MSILQAINELMHPGSRCPEPGVLGECAAIFRREDIKKAEVYEAHLYIWDRSFNDSSKVAGWFKDQGCTDIWVQHTLYSDANDDRDGSCFGEDESRHWVVTFTIASAADVAKGT